MKKLSILIIMAAAAAISCKPNKNRDIDSRSAKELARDIHDIDACEAKKLVHEYALYDGADSKKTKSVWFSYAEVHKLDSVLKVEMDSIKKANIASGVNADYTTDGIRIYFARYTYEYGVDKNMNTLVIVSTKDTLDPKYPGQSKYMHKDYYPTCSSPITPQNRGELCPNNCQGVTLP